MFVTPAMVRARSLPGLGARQLLDHALAGPLPLLQEDQEIGHLLTIRPLVELPDDVGADLAGGRQDPKEIPTRRWSERVSEANRILPKHRGASVSVARLPGELPDQLLRRAPDPASVGSRAREETLFRRCNDQVEHQRPP
jgi:hypothetical protein